MELSDFKVKQQPILKDEIIFAGRFIPKKNLVRLIQSFQQIQTDKKLVLIGQGPQKETLEKISREDKRIQIVEKMDQKLLWQRVNNCYLCCTQESRRRPEEYVLKVDIFLMRDKEHKLSNVSIGHNYFAAFSYFIMFLLFIFQAITGLALLSATSAWWFPKMFHWIVPLLGGEIAVRYFHHIIIWVFLAFIVVHVYLVFYHDVIEARGEASTMISGFKFIRSERLKESEEEIIDKTKKQMWEGDKPKEDG